MQSEIIIKDGYRWVVLTVQTLANLRNGYKRFFALNFLAFLMKD